MAGRRVELTTVSGLKFWATLFIITGHAVESLWIAEESESMVWLTRYSCSVLRRAADDLVSSPARLFMTPAEIKFGYRSAQCSQSSCQCGPMFKFPSS